MTVSITGRIAQFGARMKELVNNKMFEKFVSNITNMGEQENGDENTTGRPGKAEPIKAVSLFDSVIESE